MQSLAKHRELQAVNDEARQRVGQPQRFEPRGAEPGLEHLGCAGVSIARQHDFGQGHDRHRVHEVRDEDPLRKLQVEAERVGQQARGPGNERHTVADVGLDLAQEALLERKRLGNRFVDERDAGQRVEAFGQAHLAGRALVPDLVRGGIKRRTGPRAIARDQDRLDAAARATQGDARAHRARADHGRPQRFRHGAQGSRRARRHPSPV